MTPARPDSIDKDARIATLMARIEVLVSETAKLAARIAELNAKLELPHKGPNNSSAPPSRGKKRSEFTKGPGKARPHAGAHRPLHANPTRKRDVFATVCDCGSDVSGVAQE